MAVWNIVYFTFDASSKQEIRMSKRNLILLFSIFAFIGFMWRLPRIFHHYDKELHMAFYFFALLFLSALYPKRLIQVFFLLLFAGIGIELLQSFSNRISVRLIGKAIHGRFDWQDVKYNLLGLCWASVCYFVFLRKRVGKA